MLLALPTVDQMTDVLDIKPLYRFSLLWFWVVLSVFLLALLGTLIFLYFKNRKKEVVPAPVILPEKILTPKEKALESLEALEKLGLLERGQYRKYYFIFSEVFRTFLEEELKITAIDATTEEIIPVLQSSSLSFEQKQLVETLLHQMDLVKFARMVPSGLQVSTLRQSVNEFLGNF